MLHENYTKVDIIELDIVNYQVNQISRLDGCHIKYLYSQLTILIIIMIIIIMMMFIIIKKMIMMMLLLLMMMMMMMMINIILICLIKSE